MRHSLMAGRQEHIFKFVYLPGCVEAAFHSVATGSTKPLSKCWIRSEPQHCVRHTFCIALLDQ
jgi:hypothetical protein